MLLLLLLVLLVVGYDGLMVMQRKTCLILLDS